MACIEAPAALYVPISESQQIELQRAGHNVLTVLHVPCLTAFVQRRPDALPPLASVMQPAAVCSVRSAEVHYHRCPGATVGRHGRAARQGWEHG